MKIYVVQHCQSEHHVNGLTGGWTDTPLTQLGQEQAQKVSTYLKKVLVGTSVICSSDLLRAYETAQEISRALQVPILSEPGLRERDFGIAKDHTSDWLRTRLKPMPKDNREDHIPIEGAESWRSFYQRVVDAMDRLVDQEVDNLIVVTHGGTKNNVIAWWMGIPLESLTVGLFAGRPGAITTLSANDDFHILKELSYMGHLV